MACFIVPAVEAIATTVVTKVIRTKEEKQNVTVENSMALRFSDKMKWLNNMLWGGSALLALEHLWHGEVSPFFPFLTAAENPVEATAMLHEMATSGVAMAALVTCVWAGMVLVTGKLQKKSAESQPKQTEEMGA